VSLYGPTLEFLLVVVVVRAWVGLNNTRRGPLLVPPHKSLTSSPRPHRNCLSEESSSVTNSPSATTAGEVVATSSHSLPPPLPLLVTSASSSSTSRRCRPLRPGRHLTPAPSLAAFRYVFYSALKVCFVILLVIVVLLGSGGGGGGGGGKSRVFVVFVSND